MYIVLKVMQSLTQIKRTALNFLYLRRVNDIHPSNPNVIQVLCVTVHELWLYASKCNSVKLHSWMHHMHEGRFQSMMEEFVTCTFALIQKTCMKKNVYLQKANNVVYAYNSTLL